jgi:hypothetical protein
MVTYGATKKLEKVVFTFYFVQILIKQRAAQGFSFPNFIKVLLLTLLKILLLYTLFLHVRPIIVTISIRTTY